MEKNTWLTMSDGEEIFIQRWGSDREQPRAILQIAHGKGEHIARYKAFAENLVDNGFLVYGNDHRGHGQTGEKNGLLGFFADVNGFERVVEDLREINIHIQTEYPNVPILLFGHSMGSFIVRRFVQRFHDNVKGVIISGTGGNPGLLGKIGKLLAKLLMYIFGNRAPSPLLDKLTFSAYNKKFSDVHTEFDWLSRDRTVVQAYIDDPLCGTIATTGFFYDLVTGLEIIHNDYEMAKMNKSLPFLFISGDEDPVGNNKKGVLEVIDQFKRHGVKTVDAFFYKGGRHEMLNETNREEVMNDVLQWINKQLMKG